NNKSDASTLLYNGLLSNPEYPFGTKPYFISRTIVSNISFASLNLLVFNNNPSNAIKLSRPQSKNHGYPAIIVCKPKDGLYTTNVSEAIIKFLIKFFCSSSSILSSNSV